MDNTSLNTHYSILLCHRTFASSSFATRTHCCFDWNLFIYSLERPGPESPSNTSMIGYHASTETVNGVPRILQPGLTPFFRSISFLLLFPPDPIFHLFCMIEFILAWEWCFVRTSWNKRWNSSSVNDRKKVLKLICKSGNQREGNQISANIDETSKVEDIQEKIGRKKEYLRLIKAKIDIE